MKRAITDLLHFNRDVRRPLKRAFLLMGMVLLITLGMANMAVLAADKEVDRKVGGLQSFPVADGETIYKGALVVVSSTGYLEALTDAASKRFAGVAYEKKDNSGGSDGTLNCRVYTEGVFLLTATSITQAMVGQMMYGTDDQTIDDTTGGTYYIAVGRLIEYVSDTSGWVNIGQRHLVGGADNILLAPNATKMFEVHTWGIVMASNSFYVAADYGAYITSLQAGYLHLVGSTGVSIRVGANIWNVTAAGCASAYPVTLTAELVMSGVGAKVALAQVPSPSTRPGEGRIWYNSTDKKLEFSTDTGVELITSVLSHTG